MKELSDRIKLIRKKIGVNQQGLADILGCTDGKIKGWEQGKTKTIKYKDMMLLTNKYGFSQEWIEDGKGEMMINKGDLLLKDIAATAAMLNSNISIPFYKDINASAGYGCTNSECEPSYITLDPSMLPSMSTHIDAISVMGNSMSGTVEDEDIIFVDKNDTQPINGKIYVVYLCEEVYVKRLFIDPNTKKIILQSDNPLFPQFEADCEDFKVIGRVVANMNISKL